MPNDEDEDEGLAEDLDRATAILSWAYYGFDGWFGENDFEFIASLIDDFDTLMTEEEDATPL